jgi:hypothetical protein
MARNPNKPINQPRLHQMTAAELAEFYSITFTPRELDLLNGGSTAEPEYLRDPLDAQRIAVLRLDLTPVPCPACGLVICRRSAYTGDPDPDRPGGWNDDANACPHCKAKLTWHLSIVGEQWFTLSPGQAVTVR